MTLTPRKDIRNVAIIAHVDHGKTTLVDAMLHQGGLFRDNEVVADRAMDRMDQERERGITIMAKNTGIKVGDTILNIVDTPGHADFGGEVERTLHMVDGVLLLVDAAEGPLPQTRFVLEKALKLGLAPLVCVNKVDRKDARPDEVMQEIYELFIDLGAEDHQLNFPVLFAVARDGWAVKGMPMEECPKEALHPNVEGQKGIRDLKPLFEAIIEHVPPPMVDMDGPVVVQVNAIDYDDYIGRLATGRVVSGTLNKNDHVFCKGVESTQKGRVSMLANYQGLARKETEQVKAGDLIVFAGLDAVVPGDTLVTDEETPAMDRIAIDEPTVSAIFKVNDGPFAGKEGKYVTSRQIRDRLHRETRGNVSLHVEQGETPDQFRVTGRGELQLAVVVETMRREGYELCVSRPEVVVKEIDGKKMEPREGVVADVPETAIGGITEALGRRGGALVQMGEVSSGRCRVEFRVPTRGLIGFRNLFLTLTRGEGIMSTFFDGWVEYQGETASRKAGALISAAQGKTTTYALFNLQPRGHMFVKEQTQVYEGMVIGEHTRENDIDINACKEKKLTNVRTAGKDEAAVLAPHREMGLDKALEWIDMDELVEVTPENIRIRKRILKANQRPKKKKLA